MKTVVIFEEFFEQTTFSWYGFGTPDYSKKILIVKKQADLDFNFENSLTGSF